jgi:HK97 family phage major capsid protein
MAIELEMKEVKDFLEEKLQLVHSKFDKAREEDRDSFNQRVVDAVKDLKNEFQKEIDNGMIDLQEKFKKNEGKKEMTFYDAFQKSLKDQKDEVQVAMKNAVTRGGNSVIELKAFNYDDFTGYADFATEFRNTPILLPYEDFHYRRVLRPGSMSGEFVKFPKETNQNAGAGPAVWTPASGSKPEIEPKVSNYTAEAEWIAGLIKDIPVSMLEDFSFMTSYLTQKATNELTKAEDLALQNGSGGISGLLEEATLYNGSKTIFVEKLIDAGLRQIKNAHFTVNGYIVSNEDYTNMILQKASGGSEEYNTPAVMSIRPDGTLTLLNTPIFATSYLNAGQALVGDWREAQLLVRSNPRLRIFEQNGTDAEKNQLMMRIEERIALAVYHQSAFVKLAAYS